MDADKIYLETVRNIATAISGHACPNGRTSLSAFCECYGFSRQNLTQLLLGTRGHDMSLGLFLRICYYLNPDKATCRPPSDTDPRMAISLRHCLGIDFVGLYASVMSLEFS
jgi:hypothetical protein